MGVNKKISVRGGAFLLKKENFSPNWKKGEGVQGKEKDKRGDDPMVRKTGRNSRVLEGGGGLRDQ